MINPIYPTLVDRLRRLEIEISIPCRHGWRWAHCDRDDEGSHISEGGDGILRSTDGSRALLETDGCYCGEARHLVLPLDLLRLVDRLNRRRFLQAARAAGLTRIPRARGAGRGPYPNPQSPPMIHTDTPPCVACKVNWWPHCRCGRPMYLIGRGRGVYACRIHDAPKPDLPPTTGPGMMSPPSTTWHTT